MLAIRSNTTIIPSLRDGTRSVLSNATITGAGTYFTEPIDVSSYSELIAYLNVTAAGTTLDIKFQGSGDGKYFDDLTASGDKFTQVTTNAGHQLLKVAANFGKYIRAVITITGTAYTFSLTLQAKG